MASITEASLFKKCIEEPVALQLSDIKTTTLASHLVSQSADSRLDEIQL